MAGSLSVTRALSRQAAGNGGARGASLAPAIGAAAVLTAGYIGVQLVPDHLVGGKRAECEGEISPILVAAGVTLAGVGAIIAMSPTSGAARTVTEEEAWRMFRTYDQDGDGKVTRQELRAHLKTLGHNVSNAQMRLLFNRMDADHSESISFAEFCGFLAANNGITVDSAAISLSEAHLRKIYVTLDTDKDGTVSPAEFAAFCGKATFLQLPITTATLADENNDGRIDFGEFVQIWLGQSLRSFKAIDADGSGTLDHDEIKAVMPTMTAELFDAYDPNHDGVWTFEEFFLVANMGYLHVHGPQGQWVWSTDKK